MLTFPPLPQHHSAPLPPPPIDTSEGGRVYVKQSAIDDVRRLSIKASSNSQLRRSNSYKDNSSVAETESCTDHSSVNGRHLTWAWKEATLIENSQKIVLRLNIALQDDDLSMPSTVQLPATAWAAGDIVLANDYETCNDTGAWKPPHDLITLTHLHEPAVVEALQHRFAADQIYTSTGPVLLALNPFTTLRGMYGETIQKKYWDKAEKQKSTDLPPHVYQIADASFRDMMRLLEDGTQTANQSILVSGESGAGKTVTTKFVMKYLAALSQRSAVLSAPEKRAHIKIQEMAKQPPPSPQRMSPSKTKRFQQVTKRRSSSGFNKNTKQSMRRSDSTDLASATLMSASNSIEATVLQSNPILESFGNARTVRNDNSSRFGKFIEMQFTATGKLVGARIDTYLLEKVRLSQQQQGERNFHIFYELLSGTLSVAELSRFFLAPTALPEDFRATAHSGTYDRRDGVSDQETCRGLLAAMQAMKFSDADAVQVFGIAAAVLHASNLTFQELADDASALDKANAHLKPVCRLLGVSAEELEEALCACHIQAGRQDVRRSHTPEKACKGLEALLQTVYGALFGYLVRRINDSIACQDGAAAAAASIGVLDIFGFESFHVNSFEQLCINYCNEALQQQFNAFVLKNEQAEYEREGIEWSFIEFPENQDVLDLIETRGNGILSILDDQCRAPGPSDKAFAINVYNQCKNLPRFSASRKQTATLQFSVHHYAGPVEYTTEGFVEKNRDELPKETTELLKASSNVFVQELAEIIEAGRAVPAEGRRQLRRADSTVGRATVGGQFRSQLRDLRNKIEVTTPHYVRCLKPNDLLVPDVFDTAIVAEQLRCGGILEAVRVARAGFTQHYPHAEFVRRYRALAWREMAKSTAANTSAEPRYSSSSWNGGFRGVNYAAPSPRTQPQKKQPDSKALCRDLVRVLYRKLNELAGDDEDSSSNDDNTTVLSDPPSLVVKAKTYQSSTRSAPSWSKSPRTSIDSLPPTPQTVRPRFSYGSSWENKKKAESVPSRRPSSPWKRGGFSASDYLKVGIQMGKSKVFLRHKCFENLERLRSLEQTKAATKLNSIFRRYLARIAYLPFRNAFRREIAHRMTMNGEEMMFEEKKEVEFDSPQSSTNLRRQSARFSGGAYLGCYSLVDKWMDSQIRDAIHNPVPRHEWGKQAPGQEEIRFKWVLADGIWIKNYEH